MLILGLNAFHGDSSACLLKDGRLIAAAEEERFLRIKHWAGFPAHAIAWCLDSVGAEIKDLDVVAINSDSKARIGARFNYILHNRPTVSYMVERFRHRMQRKNLHYYFESELQPLASATRIHYVEHHRAHLASGFYCAPFDEAAIMSIDGFGDFCSTAWGSGLGTQIQIDDEVLFPHSLGIFYQAMTQFLGFTSYGDEYKVMGLASYGKKNFLPQMEQLVSKIPGAGYQLNLKYFRHHRDKVNFQWQQSEPRFDSLYSPVLEELLGPARIPGSELTNTHKDLACSVQCHYEDILTQLLDQLQSSTGQKNLALAGGCAMNSVANGNIYARNRFEQVYVQPAAGDAGGALGAALCAELDHQGTLNHEPMLHAAWGPEFTTEHIQSLLKVREGDLTKQSIETLYCSDGLELCEMIASQIAAGDVVGWFQGRMEWGPRALGHRSILADPRRADIQEVLNQKIKRRENFRPFAPSILREAVDEWFETDVDVPFMMKVLDVKPERRGQIPAVVHVDGSGRLQTVTEQYNGRFYQLIKSFSELTGIPMLLNTSFNENEPIVCKPEEALDCFLRTGMDCLVLDQFVLRRGET